MFRRSRTGSYTQLQPSVLTLFDLHLKSIYESPTPVDGVEFFESAGYYDDVEGNTIQAFMDYTGLKSFWGDDTESSGATHLCDDDLEFEEEIQEALTELGEDERAMKEAIKKIRIETVRFQQSFFQAFNDDNVQAAQRLRDTTLLGPGFDFPTIKSTDSSIPRQPTCSFALQLPPFHGHLRVLKSPGLHFLGSWHKRYFYLDFTLGQLNLFKRSYWRLNKGKVDMWTVTNVQPLNKTDLQLDAFGGLSLHIRARNMEERDLWVSLLLFARRQARAYSLFNNASNEVNGLQNFRRASLRAVAWLEDRSAEIFRPTPSAA